MSKNQNKSLYSEINSFELPIDYFSISAESISNKINWVEEHKSYFFLSSQTKISGFIIPESYFNSTEYKFENSSYHHALINKKEAGFIVNQNYFLANKVLIQSNLSVDNKSAIIIPFFSNKVFKAIAAFFLIAIAIWGYQFYLNNNIIKNCGTLACVDKINLIQFNTLQNIENDELFQLVNSKKLEQNLNKKLEDINHDSKNNDNNSSTEEDLLDQL